MYSFKIGDNPYSIPESAIELTLGQFIALQGAKDELSMITALMGSVPVTNCKDEAEMQQLTKQLDGLYKLIKILSTDVQATVNSGLLLTTPKTVTILGLTIPVKENFVQTLPYWGYVHTKQTIINRAKLGQDEQFNATDLIPEIIAHNMYALVTKAPYNEAKAEEFIEVVNEMNFIEAMQLGNFFLLQQKKLWSTKQKRWRMHLKLWRLRLVSKFLINTARSIPSKHLAVEMLLNGKK